MWLNKSINVTEISSEDFEYLVNRFGTMIAKDVFSKSDLEDLELEEDYPVVVIKYYKEDFEYDLIFAFKVGSRYYKGVRKAHSHMFLNCLPTLSPSDIMQQIKGYTSKILREEFSELSKMPSLWTRSYFVSTAGNVCSETIKNYVENQKKRY